MITCKTHFQSITSVQCITCNERSNMYNLKIKNKNFDVVVSNQNGSEICEKLDNIILRIEGSDDKSESDTIEFSILDITVCEPLKCFLLRKERKINIFQCKSESSSCQIKYTYSSNVRADFNFTTEVTETKPCFRNFNFIITENVNECKKESVLIQLEAVKDNIDQYYQLDVEYDPDCSPIFSITKLTKYENQGFKFSLSIETDNNEFDILLKSDGNILDFNVTKDEEKNIENQVTIDFILKASDKPFSSMMTAIMYDVTEDEIIAQDSQIVSVTKGACAKIKNFQSENMNDEVNISFHILSNFSLYKVEAKTNLSSLVLVTREILKTKDIFQNNFEYKTIIIPESYTIHIQAYYDDFNIAVNQAYTIPGPPKSNSVSNDVSSTSKPYEPMSKKVSNVAVTSREIETEKKYTTDREINITMNPISIRNITNITNITNNNINTSDITSEHHTSGKSVPIILLFCALFVIFISVVAIFMKNIFKAIYIRRNIELNTLEWQ